MFIGVPPLIMLIVFSCIFVVACFQLLRAQQTKGNFKQSTTQEQFVALYSGVTALFYLFAFINAPGELAIPSLHDRGAAKVLFDFCFVVYLPVSWLFAWMKYSRLRRSEEGITTVIQEWNRLK